MQSQNLHKPWVVSWVVSELSVEEKTATAFNSIYPASHILEYVWSIEA